MAISHTHFLATDCSSKLLFWTTGLSFRLTHCYSSNLGHSRNSCSTALLESSRSHILGNPLLRPSLAFQIRVCYFMLICASHSRQFRPANRFDGHAITAPQTLKGVFAESLIVQ